MNKRLLITLTTILVIIALTFAFVACNKDGKGDDVTPTPDPDNLSETDFFTALQEVTNPKIDVMIADYDDTVIYSIDANGVVYEIEDFEGLAPVPQITGGVNFDAQTFSSTSISGKVLTGEVRNPLAFLGIEDESVTVTNTKVTIEVKVDGDNKITLMQAKITSNATIDDIGFKLTVTVLP